jgi:SAM-dependent methyltransferase
VVEDGMAVTVRRPIMGALRAVGLAPTAVRVRRGVGYWLHRDLRRQNAEFIRAGAPDGWPLPPPELVFRVVGHHDLPKFYKQGIGRGNYIRGFLARNGVEIASFRAILDFGCGCGRVARQWANLESTKVYGSDLDPDLIAWCRANLTFAEFATNGLAPPLPYADRAFDFVYAISVFTHLSADLQRPWMDEMARVIEPGGYLLFTTHGPDFFGRLTPGELRRAESGELVVRASSVAGSNMCAAYHAPDAVAALTEGLFEVVDRVPGAEAPTLSGAILNPQQLAARGGVAPPRQDGHLVRRLGRPAG